MAHWKNSNESLGGRVLVDVGGDEKQGIYFAYWQSKAASMATHLTFKWRTVQGVRFYKT